MKKLHCARGETLIESLCAILLVALVMLFLSTAIATAARINLQVRDTDITFRTDEAAAEEVPIKICDENGAELPGYTGTVRLYTTKDTAYRYYRYFRIPEVTVP